MQEWRKQCEGVSRRLSVCAHVLGSMLVEVSDEMTQLFRYVCNTMPENNRHTPYTRKINCLSCSSIRVFSANLTKASVSARRLEHARREACAWVCIYRMMHFCTVGWAFNRFGVRYGWSCHMVLFSVCVMRTHAYAIYNTQTKSIHRVHGYAYVVSVNNE